MKDIYLQFGNPSIKGESNDKDHAEWIEISSFKQSIHQPRSVTASTSGGHTSERTEHGAMILTKDVDLVSPLLYQHSSGGTTFDEVTIDFMRADGEGNRVKYLEVKLKHVIICDVETVAGLQIDAADSAEAALDSSKQVSTIPTDRFKLKYAAIQWKYTKQKIGGNQNGVTQGAWSLTKNDKTYSV
ncbi:MAG: type VI secretion system tube protein Hcp [Burkholderiales bacterium]|jgi:type VI secretion system secreted protein Hcp|nr:type VI secretion system tube protein Hcp [Burkholderiales bacterium]